MEETYVLLITFGLGVMMIDGNPNIEKKIFALTALGIMYFVAGK